MIKKRILVITDDGAVCRSIKERMENDSTDVCCVNAPSEVLDNFVKWEYCLAIIDFGLSGMDGLETLRIMRKIKQTPILVLTSYLSANDKVALFQAGANAYIEKPIDTTVCVAQATALIQLFGDSDNIPHKCHPIVFGAELIINPLYRQVVIDSTPVELTRTEFDLFFCLAQHPGQVWSRNQLYRHVWGDTLGIEGENTVRAHIGNLRKKLTEVGKEYIQTTRGVGYRFVPPNIK